MSLLIGIRFLTGYCVAARTKTDPRPEWPPHPARLFAALAAAHFECLPGEAEAAALGWLESLAPPEVHFGPNAKEGEAMPAFVPVNYNRSDGGGNPIRTLPALKRWPAERLFPRTHLPDSEDTVYMAWPEAPDAEIGRHRPALLRLCGAVARVGHSRSLAQVWVTDEVPAGLKALVPDDVRPEQRLRAVARTSGTLARLATAFTVPPYRGELKAAFGYAATAPAGVSVAGTVFDPRLEVFALRPEGGEFRWLALETTLALAATLRAAILKRCNGPIPESVSGHTPDGGPTAEMHMAIAPLPFIGGEHGDGHLLGVAVILPRGISDADRGVLRAALGVIADDPDEGERGHGLGFNFKHLPGLGQWRLVRQGVLDDARANLRADTWTGSPGGFHNWASVTPVVFDQHGRARNRAAYLDECAAAVAESAARVVSGAAVLDVRVTPVSPLRGVPPARDFPRLRRKDGTERRHTHAVITFDRPVVGPLLVGAGRYRGYGLLRPATDGEAR